MIGDAMASITAPPEITHPPDLEEFLSVKGSVSPNDFGSHLHFLEHYLSQALVMELSSALVHT
jgi:hypothetical protein